VDCLQIMVNLVIKLKYHGQCALYMWYLNKSFRWKSSTFGFDRLMKIDRWSSRHMQPRSGRLHRHGPRPLWREQRRRACFCLRRAGEGGAEFPKVRCRRPTLQISRCHGSRFWWLRWHLFSTA
jgi:hypothetical protein